MKRHLHETTLTGVLQADAPADSPTGISLVVFVGAPVRADARIPEGAPEQYALDSGVIVSCEAREWTLGSARVREERTRSRELARSRNLRLRAAECSQPSALGAIRSHHPGLNNSGTLLALTTATLPRRRLGRPQA